MRLGLDSTFIVGQGYDTVAPKTFLMVSDVFESNAPLGV